MTTDKSAYVSIIYFLGLSILSHFISRRSIPEASSWKGLKGNLTSWPRLCVLIIFIDSWAFLFASGFLTLAIGLEENHHVCSAAIYMCIVFYTTSKFFIYAFLIEKVHIVWSPPEARRFQSRPFVLCFIALIAYFVIIILNLFGRIHYIFNDLCIIGLQRWSALPLLAYDLIMNFVLTGLFVWPIKRNRTLNPMVKRVARRSFIASSFALTSSTTNIAVLGVLHGREPGWVCLACCSADVLVNAYAIYWATSLNLEGQQHNLTTFPQDNPGLTSASSMTSPSFTVTTTHSQHIISSISPTSTRLAIGKVVTPQVLPSLSMRENGQFDIVRTIQTHTFQPGLMVFSNGAHVLQNDGSDHVLPDIQEDDGSSVNASTLTADDEIINAAFVEEVENEGRIDYRIPFEETAVTRT
ncbi:hypothetical protein DL96DRAFT_1607964 [Flagelloscypha sp. PMI_526]|nr:hypothetical protein DL96DRAFT_1607964 [Flagelloscypha sp. PMI_526]